MLPPGNVSDHAIMLLQEFQTARQLPPKLVQTIRPTCKPLDHDELKTNFDGAMFEDSQEASIGAVVRNSHGEVLMPLAKKIPKPSLVFLLETLASRRAMLFVHELSFCRSSFEGDSEILINALQLQNSL